MATLGPITSKIKVLKGRGRSGRLEDEERKFSGELDEQFNLIIYDVTDPNKRVENGKSVKEDKYEFKISGDGLKLLPAVQKSIAETVYAKATNSGFYRLRANRGNNLPPEKRAELVNDGVPGVTNFNPDALPNVPGLEQEGTEAIQDGGVSPNLEEEKVVKFPERLYYPETLESNQYKQDYIFFKVLDYKPRFFVNNNFRRNERFINRKNENIKKVNSRIWLPIQGGISDANVVNWSSENLNAFEQAAALTSLSIQSTEQRYETIGQHIEQARNLLTDPKVNSGMQSYLHSLMSKMAITKSGANFFSRAFGAILNPNLELLFNNTELRNFSFRFDLTPRNENEAKKVKQIIRVFKQSMAPRIGIADIFLKTPMVYEIEYINGKTEKVHQSMNKIKTCALRTFNVNYTPLNQFMTYNDPENTMTAYSLDMSFVELEPVFFDDYNSIPMTEIGY